MVKKAKKNLGLPLSDSDKDNIRVCEGCGSLFDSSIQEGCPVCVEPKNPGNPDEGNPDFYPSGEFGTWD